MHFKYTVDTYLLKINVLPWERAFRLTVVNVQINGHWVLLYHLKIKIKPQVTLRMDDEVVVLKLCYNII